MAVHVETTTGRCDWRLEGRCVRRMRRCHPVVRGNFASPRLGPPPTALDILDFIRSGGSLDELPNCDALAGPCPHLPVFDGHVLYFRGEVVLSYDRRCRQTNLLAELQFQGWPEFIEDHSGDDTENGLRDIVLDLKNRQGSWERVHFWCEGRRLFWKVNGDEPADR